MRDHLAEIRHGLVLAVHPAVPLPLVVLLQLDAHRADQVQIDQVQIVQVQVALHLRGLLHLPHHQDRLVQIANVAVKIFRLVAVHPIVLVQRVKYRKGVKPVIHAGFVPSR